MKPTVTQREQRRTSARDEHVNEQKTKYLKTFKIRETRVRPVEEPY
jgi:hypothetical protein